MSQQAQGNNIISGSSLSGAATGAAIGTAVAPGVGTAIGAGIGLVVGSTFGSVIAQKKAAKKQKKQAEMLAMAQNIQMERAHNAQQENFLQQIRNARVSRAGSLAASVSANIATSSLATAALSSIGAQSQHNIQYTANDIRLYQLYAMYMQEAGALADSYRSMQASNQATANLYSSIGKAAMSYGLNNMGSTGLENGDVAQGDSFVGGNMPSGILGI